MGYYKKKDVIGITHNGFFHVACYEGHLNDLEEINILKVNDFDEEDWLFCDKCKKPILYPNLAKAKGRQSQGVKDESVLNYRNLLIPPKH